MKLLALLLGCLFVLTGCSTPERHSNTGTLYPDAAGASGRGGNTGAGTR